MDIQKEREVFESVFTEAKGWDLTFIMGCYQNIKTLTAFAGWQAAKAQAVPEGFVLVPVETLDEALSWANCAASETWTDEQREEIDKHYEVIEKAMIEAQEPE